MAFGKAMVVTTDEMDMYSEKKLKHNAVMNGRILEAIRSFSLHNGHKGLSVAAEVSSSPLSGEEPVLLYWTSFSFVMPTEPFSMESFSSMA